MKLQSITLYQSMTGVKFCASTRLVYWLLAFLAGVGTCLAQNQLVKGIVVDQQGTALPGANVYWSGTTVGVVSNQIGRFELPFREDKTHPLVVSFVGFTNDTLDVSSETYVTILLSPNTQLQEVTIQEERNGSFISNMDPVKTEVITEIELSKAACCDLAGCFNTQASVESTTSNVITQSKELRILGISGVYNQILVEGFPMIYGTTYTYGISNIPGTLVKNIFVAKGANSVLQGFENISGQINVLYKEPLSEKLLVNLYANSFQEKQFNLNTSHKLGNWAALWSVHTAQPGAKIDGDDDNFLDLPKTSRYSILNKWEYGKLEEKGWYSSIGWRMVKEKRVGGQENFDSDIHKGSHEVYGQTLDYFQPEFFSKDAFRFNKKEQIVVFLSSLYHQQTSWFGTANYEAEQFNLYGNIQYELDWKKHSLKSGFSLRKVRLEEEITFEESSLIRNYDGVYLKEETIPGVFVENAFRWPNWNLSLTTGLRIDHHNDFGWKATPRLLAKYDFSEYTALRFAFGTGWRTINLFSENINLLASSRDVIIADDLRPEEARNYGSSLTHKIYGNRVESQFSVDFYRTDFSNQIFPNYQEATKAFVRNFDGTAVSNSFQAEASSKIDQKIELKLAYNFLDVYRMVNEEKIPLPFISQHRLSGSFSFKPESKKWHFDSNVHWYGSQRLPNTFGNPEEFQMPEKSEDYLTIDAQFTRSWKAWDLYFGCENILNFRQERPILSWQEPFGPYFDTASVWGPTKGREFYIGFRYSIKN